MKFVLLILLFITTALAVDKTNVVLYNETLYSSDHYVLKSMNGTDIKDECTFNNKLRVRLYSYLLDDLYFSTTGVYNYNNISDDYKHFIMYNDKYVDKEVYFESLYLTYRLVDKLYITAGLVNFSEGSYVEISELDYIKGSGLYKIISTPIESVFLTYNSTIYGWYNNTKIGYGTYNRYNIKKTSIVDTHSNDAKGWYVTDNMYKDFDSIKINYFNVDIYKDSLYVANAQLLGLGYNKYFLKPGINIFSTLGYSHNVVNTVNIKKILYGIVNPALPIIEPDAFELDKSTTNGYLLSLGVNKDFSSSLIESYSIGFDYTYTSDNWYSLVNNDINDYFNTRYINGENYYAWFTLRPTKNLAIKTYYNVVKLREASSIGNNTVTIPFDKSIRPFLSSLDRVGIKVIFKY